MTESRFLDPEDEAFNEIERQAKQRKESVKANLVKADPSTFMSFDEAYDAGWNSALNMAAFKIESDFKQAFGADTLSSIAIYIRGMKK